MIRRNLPLGAEPREWLLISQIEHARISRLLAEHWGYGEVQPVVCWPDESDTAKLQIRREALAAIGRHDEGWASWEAAPQLDPELGRPLDFIEMSQADSLAIWEQSIRAARNEGPLAGAMTAGHFLALLANSHHELSPAAIEWRSAVGNRRAEWLHDWREVNPESHSREIADRALRWLQVFDWLSLWLCCTCPEQLADSQAVPKPLELDVPGEGNLRVAFRGGEMSEDNAVVVSPWPFDVSEMRITASCYSVPADQYRTTDDLLAAQRLETLQWSLMAVPI